MRPKIKLLVTDLDNTLYDWVTFFSRAFYAMVNVAVETLGVPREQLLDELRDVHRKHHNSEQPFGLLETATVKRMYGHLPRRMQVASLDNAFHAFNSARKNTLAAYSGVEQTLGRITAGGTVVVGHTEATVTNAQFRLSTLGLSRYLSALYAVEHFGAGHPDPERRQPLDEVLEVRHLRQDERKPDPQILFDICRDFGVSPLETLYVGDSVSRDIGMAKEAGVWAAWAKYGLEYEASHWAGLVRVTHWTDEDVRRASEAKARYGNTAADVVLQNGFDDLLENFDFVRSNTQGS
jgi:phosphoglycolate phosphatase